MSVTMLTPNSGGQLRFFTWTHTDGEAEETFTVYGPVLGVFAWDDADNSTPVVVKCVSSLNTTTGINTITIQSTSKTTTGKGFVITSMR